MLHTFRTLEAAGCQVRYYSCDVNNLQSLSETVEKIERELDEIVEKMGGEAAYDYARLTELDEKKNALEERLMEIYEELEA